MNDKQVSLNEVLGLIQKRADQYEMMAEYELKDHHKRKYQYWRTHQWELDDLKKYLKECFDYKED